VVWSQLPGSKLPFVPPTGQNKPKQRKICLKAFIRFVNKPSQLLPV